MTAASKTGGFSAVGIVCAVLASALFAANAMALKLTNLPAIEQMLIRSAAQHILLLPILTVQMKRGGNSNIPEFLVGRPSLFLFMLTAGVLSALASIFCYEAVQRLPLGDAVSIFGTDVFFTGIIAHFMLRERFSLLDGGFAFAAFTGVVLIAKPDFIFGSSTEKFAPSKGTGVLMALLAATSVSFMINIIRKLSLKDKIPAHLNVWYSSICGSILALVGTFTSGSFVYPCHEDYFYIFLFILFGAAAQTFYTISMQYERANTVAVLMTTTIIFSMILQVTCLDEIPSIQSLIGAALILACSVGIITRKKK